VEASFTIRNTTGETIGSGTLSINDMNMPTTGSFNATIKTKSGADLEVNLNYEATVNNSLFTSMTFTGSMTAPGLSLDFSQEGRKLYATFAKVPESPNPDDLYPTSILFSGRVTTTTAQMDGKLDIASIVWASEGGMDWDWYTHQLVCVGDLRPKNGTFNGSFTELKDSSPTGVKFSGTVTATWDNAETYSSCDPQGSTNFAKWSASFDGNIEAPSRPTIKTFLKVTQSEYGKVALDVSYTRTNPDGTIVRLSGSGMGEEKPNPDRPWDPDEFLTATLTNQDGMVVDISYDRQESQDKKFTGTISTSGGTKVADLYTIYGVPMVKYTDNTFESIF